LQTAWFTGKRETDLSSWYFKLSILSDDHCFLVRSVLPDEEKPEIRRKYRCRDTRNKVDVTRENLVTASPPGNLSRQTQSRELVNLSVNR
jgi:hypothetical protein